MAYYSTLLSHQFKLGNHILSNKCGAIKGPKTTSDQGGVKVDFEVTTSFFIL